MATEAPVAEAPASADNVQALTGLETQTYDTNPVTGTVADILSARRKSPPKDEKEKEKAEKLDKASETLRQQLFKPRKAKEEKSVEQIAPVEEPGDEKPEEAARVREVKPATTKKVVVKDRNAELAERLADLERERLDIEKQKLELERKRLEAPASRVPDQEAMRHLSPDERYEYEVFQKMGGDLAKRFLEVAGVTARYKADWEKKNPGNHFDPEDSEHDAFFADNQIKYDKLAFRRAEAKLANEGEENPKVKELERQNAEIRAEQRLRSLEPQIREVFADNIEQLIGVLDKDVAKAARESKEKLLSEYPEEGEELVTAASALEAISFEAHRILEVGASPEPGNRAQQHILSLIRQQEALIPRQPRDQRLDPEGRDFATWDQWVSMTPNQQANHWHLGAREVTDIVTADIAQRLKTKLDVINRAVERRMKKVSVAEARPAPTTRSPAASPAAASKSSVDTTGKVSAGANDAISKIISSTLFKRSS